MRILLVLFTLLFTVSAYAKEYFFVDVTGVISTYTDKYIAESLKKAKEKDGVLIIKLDTPGGVLD